MAGGKSKAYKIAFKLDAMLGSGFGKTFEEAENRFARIGDKISSVGKGLTMGVTMPLLGIGVAALAIGADYDNSLGKIQARTEMTAYEVNELSDSFRAMAVSGDYGIFSARQIAEAYADIAVRGQDAAFGTEIMRTSMVLATAVGDDLGNTAYFLGNYLLKVGKDASYAEKYINLFAATNQRTGIGLNTLQDYLFRANASLNAAGISGTEATAVFGQLYQAGVRGANAYSGFQQAIETMLLPTAAQTDAFRRLGISTDSLEWQSKSTMDQLFALGDALEGVTDGTERLDLMSTLFTQQSARAFADELFNQRDGLRELIPELYETASAVDGTGTAFQMAAIQQEGMSGSVQQLKNSLEEIMLQISEHLLPHAIGFVDFIGVWINRFASLDKGTQRIVITLGLVAAAAGPMLMVTGKIVKTVGAAHAAYKTFKNTLLAVKTATQLATAAQVAKTKATGFNTLAANADKAASAARKAATAAETKAVRMAEKAEMLRVTTGAKSAKTMAAVAQAEHLRTVATTKASIANQRTAAAETARAMATKANTAALTADTTATKANTLATSKLGKAYALSLKAKAASATALKAKSVALAATATGSGVLALATKGLSVAFKVMSIAIMKIPVFGWILAAVAGVIAIVGVLITLFRRVGAEYQAVGKEVEALADRQLQLTDSAANSADEFMRNARIMQEYGSQLDSVADRTEHLANMQAANLSEKTRLNREAIELDLELQDVYTRRMEIYDQLNDGSRRRRADTRALEAALEDIIAVENGYRAALEANEHQQGAVNALYLENIRALDEISRAQQQAAIETYGLEMAMRRQAFTAEEWANAQGEALDRMNRSFETYKRLTTNVFQTVTENVAVSVGDMTSNLLQNAAQVEEWSINMAKLTERGLDEGLIEQLRQAGPEAAATVRELVNAADYELDALNAAFEHSTYIAMESMKRELDPEGIAQSAEELIDNLAITILENQAMEHALIAKVNSGFDSFSSAIEHAGFDSAGYEIPNGAAQGMLRGSSVLCNAAQQIINDALATMRRAAEINSPSRATFKMFGYIMDGGIDGMYSKYDEMMVVSEDIMDGLADTMYHKAGIVETACKKISMLIAKGLYVKPQDIKVNASLADTELSDSMDIGAHFIEDMAMGMRSKVGIIEATCKNIAKLMADNLHVSPSITDIKSVEYKIPHSAKQSDTGFEIFGQIMDGGINGMNSKYGEMMKVAEDIMDGLADTMYGKAGNVERACKKISKIIAKNLHNETPDFGSAGLELSHDASNIIPFPAVSNAHSAQNSFSRYNHLNDDNSDTFSSSNPVDVIKRMGDSAYHQSGDVSVNYNPVYNIEGGGFNIEDLKTMLNQRDREGEAKLKQLILQVVREEDYRNRRLANA